MLYYVVKVILCQAIFIAIYELFLKRETFFNYNRIYVLGSSGLSFFIPFIKIPQFKNTMLPQGVIQLPEVFVGNSQILNHTVLNADAVTADTMTQGIQTGVVLQVIFGIGVLISIVWFVYKLIKVLRLKTEHSYDINGTVKIVNITKSSVAFSFLNTIFLGETIPKSHRDIIIKHELVHVRQKHSWDLLYFEGLKIMMWFNPLVYLYQNQVKQLHEFIADAHLVNQHGKEAYYKSILNQVFNTSKFAFANSFYKQSLLKKRIVMLQKTKSKTNHILKYVLVIPALFAMLIFTSAEGRAQERNDTLPTKTIETESIDASDLNIINKHYNAIINLSKDASKKGEIFKRYSGKDMENHNYILSRDIYLKEQAYLKYVLSTGKSTKTLNFKPKSYREYLSMKKTKEAKALWEDNGSRNELRLVVNDIDNLTTEEQLKYDTKNELLKQKLHIQKLIVTDGKKTIVTQLENYDDSQLVEVPFSAVDEAPYHESCKAIVSDKERKACTSTFIQKHVNHNFNTSIADSLSTGGVKRIYARFAINTHGEVVNIEARGPSQLLENEAERVLGLLPNFVSGKHNNKAVIVPYSLPIMFSVPEKNTKK